MFFFNESGSLNKMAFFIKSDPSVQCDQTWIFALCQLSSVNTVFSRLIYFIVVVTLEFQLVIVALLFCFCFLFNYKVMLELGCKIIYQNYQGKSYTKSLSYICRQYLLQRIYQNFVVIQPTFTVTNVALYIMWVKGGYAKY